MDQIPVHGQIPIEIYRKSVGHETGSSTNPDDSDVLEEGASVEIDNSASGWTMEEEDLIHQVPPGGHVETDIPELDHLEKRKLLDDPTKSWKVDVEIQEDNRPDHVDVEIVEGEVAAEFHHTLDVPDVDRDVTGDDGVSVSAFFHEIPFSIQGFHLKWTVIRILPVDGDGNRKLSSILDVMNWSKCEHDRIQRSSFSLRMASVRNVETEKTRQKK